MMDVIIYGSIVALLLLLGGMLYYIRRYMSRYRQQINELSAHCHVFMSSSIGVGQRLALLERYLGRDLYQELNQDAFPEREENLYQQASKLAALGMGKEELIEGFNLTETEADLLKLMSSKPALKDEQQSQPKHQSIKAQQVHCNTHHRGIQHYQNHQQD